MELLEQVLDIITPSDVVTCLIRRCHTANVKGFATYIRQCADVIDPPPRKPDPASVVTPPGKRPEVARLLALIPEGFSAGRYRAAADWAEYKQTLRPRDQIQSEKSWKAALSRMTKFDEYALGQMVEKAISNGWKGWEQTTGNGTTAPGSHPAARTRDLVYEVAE